MEKSEYCETKSRISQAAAQERSVSQERAFERGAKWAIERAAAWIATHKPSNFGELAEYTTNFKKHMQQ